MKCYKFYSKENYQKGVNTRKREKPGKSICTQFKNFEFDVINSSKVVFEQYNTIHSQDNAELIRRITAFPTVIPTTTTSKK
jgi:hypothetical protein